MSPKSKHRGPKNQKHLAQIFRFPVFVCGHSIPLVTRLGQSGPSIFSSKHAKVQSETRGVRNFGAKPGPAVQKLLWKP